MRRMIALRRSLRALEAIFAGSAQTPDLAPVLVAADHNEERVHRLAMSFRHFISPLPFDFALGLLIQQSRCAFTSGSFSCGAARSEYGPAIGGHHAARL
jgi:hypothetical protein